MMAEGRREGRGEPTEATERAVRAERVRTSFRVNLGILAVNPINALIVAAVLWTSSAKTALTSWFAAMALVAAARASLQLRFLRTAPPDDQTPVWGRRFVVGAAAAGILWGVGGAAFYDPASVTTQLLLTFTVG